MQFKKVDVLISENLTKEQLKEKVLTELNKISRASNPSISYIANIHDIVNGKYWICMDSETKETMGAADELIDLQSNLINAHTADFNNPHRTTVSNLTDTTITNPRKNQTLVYDGTKWVNKSVSLDGGNYAKKNEANIFTKKQSGIDGTEDANFVALSGNQTIAGVKTFSSSIVIPNATANNHSLPLGQADIRYAKLLKQNLEWTVGTGGKFTNLNDAIIEANKYIPINDVNSITIKIADGFVISEQIKPIVNPRLNVFLTSENRNVNVDCRTFTVNLDNAIALFEGITSINLLNIKLTLLHFNTKTNLYAVFGGGAPSIWHKGCEFVDFNILYEGGAGNIGSNCTFYYTKFVINKNKKDTYIFRPVGINMCLTIWGGEFELSDVKVQFTMTENGSTILSRLNPTVNNNNTQSTLWVVKDGGVIKLEYDISPSSTFNGTKLSQPKNQLTANGYIVGK